MLRSHISSRRRGGVHCRFDRKTTPSSRKADASRYFLDRAATPPCGDARRGICLTDNSRLNLDSSASKEGKLGLFMIQQVINPANFSDVVGQVRLYTLEEVDDVLAQAATSFRTWSR